MVEYVGRSKLQEYVHIETCQPATPYLLSAVILHMFNRPNGR